MPLLRLFAFLSFYIKMFFGLGKKKKPKRVIDFVYTRHGRSRAQDVTHSGDRNWDPALNDCQLALHGEKQAIQLGNKYQDQELNFGLFLDRPKVHLILVSPLTRALQTACLVLSSGLMERAADNFRVVVHPMLAEQGNIPENKGSTVKQLKEKGVLTKHPCFEKFDFSLCESEEDWPGTPDGNLEHRLERVNQFTKWLNENFESFTDGGTGPVYIFGHKDFGVDFMQFYGGVENCEEICGEAAFNTKGKCKVTIRG